MPASSFTLFDKPGALAPTRRPAAMPPGHGAKFAGEVSGRVPMTIWKRRQALRCKLTLGSLLILTGCASGETGLVMSRTTFTRRALLMDSYTFGASVSLLPQTRGGLLGYRHTAYLYPRVPGEPTAGSSAWNLFHTPLPARALSGIASTTGGLELGINPLQVGFTFGVESVCALFLPASPNTLARLHFHSGSPGQTSVEVISSTKQ